MRYPATLLFTLFLAASTAQAVSYAPSTPAKPATAPSPAAPAASAAVPAPTATATTAATPASSATASDKPVPVTAPVDLFNGKDFTGWSYFVSGKPTDIAVALQIKDGGIIALSNKPSGYVVVDPVRENYQLHVEWRWTTTTPSSSTNGGVLLHIVPGALQQNIWPVSFQFQTKVTHAGDIISMSTAKDAEQAAAATATRQKDSSEKTPGEWNSADIIVRGDTIECTVNGVPQNKVTKCVPSAGKIGFQLEGYAYELRNVKLTPLDAGK